MKIDKKKDTRIEIRISSDDKVLIDYLAARYGCSTSRYLRLMIDNAILPYKAMINKGVKTYDDFKTDFDNILQYKEILKN